MSEDTIMKSAWQDELTARFGSRVNFRKIERLLYSHDVGAMPGMVKKLYKGMPDAVVQPENVEELVWLTELARRHKLPLVPRGSGTGGYGGAVPSRGGIVVEFNRMRGILSVDTAAQTVIVEPGVIIKELDDYLRSSHHLAMRAVPTSAPGASLGGWVASGGAGIGSNTGGYVGESVVAVEMVSPDGLTVTLTGEELEWVVALEGTTGFITKITLQLTEAEDVTPVLAGFPNMNSLLDALTALSGDRVKVWHISLSSGRFHQLDQQAAAAELVQGSIAGRTEPGAQSDAQHGPTLLLVPLKSQEQALREWLAARLAGFDGLVQPAGWAEKAWQNRYNPMRLKRLGPSLIPSESTIPLNRMKDALAEMTRIFGELALEATLINAQEAAILSLALGDERVPLSYALDFSKSLHVMDIALKYGGKPYALGLFFTDLAGKKYGLARLGRIHAYKKQVDPEGLFNPDTALASKNTSLAGAMSAARLARPFTGVAEAMLPKIKKSERSLPERLAHDAFICTQCGYCRPVCSLYSGRGWESATPRGKFYFLREYAQGNIDFDQDEVDTFLMCTTCKRCNSVCQVNIPIQEDFDQMRGFLVMEKDFATYPAFYLMKAATRSEHNIWAELQKDRANWVPSDVTYKNEGELAYWAGCTASYIVPNVAQNAMHIFKEAGLEVAYMGTDESCCGAPMFMSGQWDAFAEVVSYNIEQMNKRGIKTLVTSCPGCMVFFDHYYRDWAKKLGLTYDVEIKHISELTADFIKDGRLKFTHQIDRQATWHDPCHMGRHLGIFEPPREVLQALPGMKLVEMEHNRQDGLCCGSVLTRIKEPRPTADTIGKCRLDEAAEAGTDTIYTTCPCCEFQLRVAATSTGTPVQVLDFTDAVVQALGYEPTDTAAAVSDIWAVFDKVLKQMAVSGMAQMMRDLMPQMMEQMPGYMKTAMGAMKPLPDGMQDAMLSIMKPMIPKMMPAMMGTIMPKVLPDILAYMYEKVPDMPPSMKKLLPELMPVVMADMMPKMLPHVLPLVVDDMMKQMASNLR